MFFLLVVYVGRRLRVKLKVQVIVEARFPAGTVNGVVNFMSKQVFVEPFVNDMP